jgi:hypothetical protein
LETETMQLTNRIRGKVAALAGKVTARIRRLGAGIDHGVADLRTEAPLERNGKAGDARARKPHR